MLGTDVLKILEEALPARFGGNPTDYQLLEREGNSQTQMELRVSPRLGVSSPDDVKDHFMKEIRRIYGGSLTARDWRNTGAVEVILAEPLVTNSGKVLPLHLLGTREIRYRS